jgi:hypothetical protein
MTVEEFATEALAEAHDGGLSVEDQVEILKRIAVEMKRADQ